MRQRLRLWVAFEFHWCEGHISRLCGHAAAAWAVVLCCVFGEEGGGGGAQGLDACNGLRFM